MVACNIYTFIPIYNEIASALTISSRDVVVAGSSFTFFYACGLLTFSNIADRYGKKEILVWGMLASAISTGFVMASFDFWTLLISRGIQGFCLGSFAPVAFAYTFDLFDGKRRTLLLVFINSGFLFAGILGQLLSEIITAFSHWYFVFLFFSIVYFSLFILGRNNLPSTGAKSVSVSNQLVTMYKLLLNKQLIICYGIVFTLLSSFVAYYDSLTRYLPFEPKLLFQVRIVGLLGVILSFYTGNLLQKMGALKTLFLGISLALFSFIFSFFYLEISFSILLLLSSILFVSSISLLIPTMLTLIGEFSGDGRSQALSFYSFILLGGTSIAPLVIMHLSYMQTLLLLIGCFIFNFFMGILLFLQQREKNFSS